MHSQPDCADAPAAGTGQWRTQLSCSFSIHHLYEPKPQTTFSSLQGDEWSSSYTGRPAWDLSNGVQPTTSLHHSLHCGPLIPISLQHLKGFNFCYATHITTIHPELTVREKLHSVEHWIRAGTGQRDSEGNLIFWTQISVIATNKSSMQDLKKPRNGAWLNGEGSA